MDDRYREKHRKKNVNSCGQKNCLPTRQGTNKTTIKKEMKHEAQWKAIHRQ